MSSLLSCSECLFGHRHRYTTRTPVITRIIWASKLPRMVRFTDLSIETTGRSPGDCKEEQMDV